MITYQDVLEARNHSNFQDVLLNYLEPSNFMAVMEETYKAAHPDTEIDIPEIEPATAEETARTEAEETAKAEA